MLAYVHRRWSGAVRGICVTALAIGLGTGLADRADARSWPNQVRAVYSISFNGFDLGTFVFKSEVRSGKYRLTGDARLSAIFGAFSWRATTRSEGRAFSPRPKPSAYSFNYKSNSKRGRIDMKFASGAIQKISANPPLGHSSKRVPVERKHLRGVLDPMTAVMALTAGTKGNPCRRTIPIFDGKQRFDLRLSFKGKRRITNRKAVGLSNFAYVCRVRYVPIAGHKMSRGTRYLAANKGIEVLLVRAPKAGVFVPYEIVIPTIAGTAYLTSRRIDLIGRGRVALVN